MKAKERCARCGDLLRPVRTALPGIAGSLTGVLVACRPGECTVSRRAMRALLTAAITFVLSKVIEASMQRVCHCPPSRVRG